MSTKPHVPHVLVRVGDSHHGDDLRPGQIIVLAAAALASGSNVGTGKEVFFTHPSGGASWGTLVGFLTPEQNIGVARTGSLDAEVIAGIDPAARRQREAETCTDCGGRPGHMSWCPRPRPRAEADQREQSPPAQLLPGLEGG